MTCFVDFPITHKKRTREVKADAEESDDDIEDSPKKVALGNGL